MNVILLGPPGAGKGTQGALLAERSGAVRIATGELLREAVRAGTPPGQKARKYVEAGELVPDDAILELVRERLADAPADGAIFDGFPRTVAQAEAFEALLAELGRSLDAVIVIDVAEDVLVRRLSGRRTCSACGAVYNADSGPPSVPGRCDVCGGTLVARADDDPATVRHRLGVHVEQTLPLIAHYQAAGTPVCHVDGERPVDEVQRDIVRSLRAAEDARRSEAHR